MLLIAWIYGEQNQERPMFPSNTPQEDLIRASKSFDLSQQLPPVDWSQALRHLPENEIIKAVDGPNGIFADKMPVDTGGAMIERTPNDSAWYKGGLWHDNMKVNVPGLWFMSWYDVSVGPNLAAYNHVRKTASPEVANQQWAVVAPVAHCSFTRATADTVVRGRRIERRPTRHGQTRRVHLRPDESRPLIWGQRVLHRQRRAGGRVRSTPHGSARRHPRIHDRGLQGRD